ncbi:MAG: hypothetical protein IJY24_00020 [Clostridia bacterium]|nr:hypothetical protein [Clostridia bacterium]
MENKHNFSFPGGEMLAKMAAWWFVSYMYYLYVNEDHYNWKKVKTVDTRRSVFERTEKYHIYWLTEVLDMKNLDSQGNKGGLDSEEIKTMAKELLLYLSNDNGVTETQELIASLQEELDRLRAQRN